jgi:hypothetical protein
MSQIRTKLCDMQTKLEGAKQRLARHNNRVTHFSSKAQEVSAKHEKNEEELKRLRKEKKEIETKLRLANARNRELKAEFKTAHSAVIPHQKKRDSAQFEVNSLAEQIEEQKKLLLQAGVDMEHTRIKDPTMRALLRSELDKTADNDDSENEATVQKPKEPIAIQEFRALHDEYSRQGGFDNTSIVEIRRLHRALSSADDAIKTEESTIEEKCKVEHFKTEPENTAYHTKTEQPEGREDDEVKNSVTDTDRDDRSNEQLDTQTLLKHYADFQLAGQRCNDFFRRLQGEAARIQRSAEEFASVRLEDDESQGCMAIDTVIPAAAAEPEQPRQSLKRKRAEDDDSDRGASALNNDTGADASPLSAVLSFFLDKKSGQTKTS